MSNEPTSRSPELEELLRYAIEYYVEDIHTALPGKVVSYEPEKQKVDVKPLIKRRLVHEDGSEALEELPIIPDVPVVFPRAGGFFLTFPIQKDDLVMLHFMERSMDNWLSGNGDDTDPDEFRMHDFSDAVAFPGLYPFNRSIKDISSANLVMGKDEGGLQVHVTPDCTMEVKVNGDSAEAVALGNALQLFWDSVFKAVWTSHTHPTPLGTSGPPLQPLPAFDTNIISKVLKLKGP